MAVIRQIEPQRRLDTASAPNGQVSNPIGEALQGLGSSIRVAAANARQSDAQNALADEKLFNDVDEAALRQSMENANFKATTGLYQMQDRLGTEYQSLIESADPSGDGFGAAVSSSFDKQAESFLKDVPPELRPRFEELVSRSKSEWLAKATEAESGLRDNWFTEQVNDRTDKLRIQIDSAPGAADGLISAGEAFIDQTGWPEEKKRLAKKEWRRMGVETREMALVRDNPEYAARYVGGAAGLSFSMPSILAAIEHAESSGDPNAISPKGASGLMQVMPRTGAEIAVELGDTNFPHGAGTAEIQAYLQQPEVSRRYGGHYFSKMMRRYDGDIVAALAAYNAGPERVGSKDEWLESGRDLSRLPKETRDYVRKIMGRLGGGEEVVSEGGEIDVSRYPIKATDGRTVDLKNVNPGVVDRFKQLQASMGRVITINSGFRDPEHNAEVGGAKDSQHIKGDALDLNVSDMSKADRIALIQKASALGFTGIGVYNNAIHLDTGPKRYWGPDYKNGSLPSWAAEAIQGHMRGQYGTADLVQGKATGQGPMGYAPVSIPDGLTFAAYTRVREQAISSMTALQKAQRDVADAESKRLAAVSKQREEQIGLGIETREITTPVVILKDPALDDGQKTTLLKALRSRSDEDDAVTARFERGEYAPNPYDKDNRKAADTVYEKVGAAMQSDEDRAALAFDVTRETGAVPGKVVSSLRNGLNSTDTQAALSSLQQAQGLMLASRNAFDAVDGGKEIADKVAIYEGALSRGMSAEQAAKHTIRMNDPEYAERRKNVLNEKVAKDLIKKDATASSIASFMDDSWALGKPRVGIDLQGQAAIVADYKAMYEDALVETSDPDDAKAIAQANFKKLYGVSRFNAAGGDIIMRNPPEKTYPAINGKHDYLLQELKDDLTKAGVSFDKKEVWLWADLQTEGERGQGFPSYQVWYKDPTTGGFVMMDDRFAVTPERFTKLRAADLKERTDNARRIEQQNRAATIDLNRMLSGEGKPAMSAIDELEAARQRVKQELGE